MQQNEARKYILEHLRQNPHAGDTLEGITRWWLLSQQVTHSVAAVKEALEQLKSDGLIVEREVGSGRPVYVASEDED